MDELSGFLEGPVAQPATTFRSAFTGSWSFRVDDLPTLALVGVVRGAAWVTPADGVPIRVRAGDVALVLGPEPYVVSSAADVPPEVVVRAAERWTPVDAPDERHGLAAREWGREPKPSTVVVVGSYDSEGEISRRMLESLPSSLVVPSRELDTPLLSLLDEEAARGAAGQDALVRRLLDLLFLATVRAWYRRPEADLPVWYEAYEDPMVADALRLIHADPSAPWSVESIADEVGGTRTTLARRFTDMTGETPMAYLARYRLNLAADLFRATDFGLAEVCERVGYSTVYALSTAFKRVHGFNPSYHRKTTKAVDRARAEARTTGQPLVLPSAPGDDDTSDDV